MWGLQTLKLFFVIGTRPEAIKLAPVISAAQRRRRYCPIICLTGQHEDLAEIALADFGLSPDIRLRVPLVSSGMGSFVGAALYELEAAILKASPDWVLVQGDTASAFSGALSAFHCGVPLAHVEAGLRSHCQGSPFPEENYRRMIADLAWLHLAPTPSARANLLCEGIAAERIRVTGNSGVDAVLLAAQAAEAGAPTGSLCDSGIATGRLRLVLVTAHRRENIGAGHRALIEGLGGLSRRPDIRVVLVRHLNPAVRHGMKTALEANPSIIEIAPQPYRRFIALLRRAALVVTDSGGVQEDAAALGVPSLVVRTKTERHEAFDAASHWIVEPKAGHVAREAARLLGGARPAPSAAFGDGKAAERILAAIAATPLAKRKMQLEGDLSRKEKKQPPLLDGPLESYRN